MTSLDALFGARLAVIVESSVTAEVAAAARARFEAAGYTRYALFDRGSYDVLDNPCEPELLAAVTAVAETRSSRALVVAEVRVLRLAAGDYLLAHHDRVHDGHPLEAVLDLSPAAVPGAELHYRRRGQVYVSVPCLPRALAIVERGPTVTCNHTYVSKRHAGASVVRLMVLLRDVSASTD